MSTYEPEPWEGEHCNDCECGFSDVYWLPTAWWHSIAPNPDRPDAGTLCPDCALIRLQNLSKTPCPVCHGTGLAYDAVEQREVPCGGLGCKVQE